MKALDRKKMIKGICFAFIFAFAFWTLQRLFQVKWIWTVTGTETSPSTSTWEEYRNLTDNSVEVIFLGTSHVYHGIDPMYIYENSGITSYAIAGPSLRMDLSYMSLEEALKTQTPKVVFFDMSAIHWTDQQTEAKCHKITDQFGWSLTKLEYAFDNDSEEMRPLDVLFPLLRYHNRWNELDITDFKYLLNDLDETFVRGHYITYRSEAVEFNFDKDVEYTLTDRNRKYLDRIVDLCTEKGVELILCKIPSPSWYRIHSEASAELAEEYGLTYIEFYYELDEIGLDVSVDFRDTDHLNQYGAEKFCSYLIQYMQDNFEVSDQRETNQEWNEDLESYKELSEQVEAYQLEK